MTTRKQSSIQGGVVDDISAVLKKLFETIFKGIDTLLEGLGFEKEGDIVETKENNLEWRGQYYRVGDTKQKVYVQTAIVQEHPVMYALKISAKGHPTKTKNKLTGEQVEDMITEYISDEFDGSSNEGPVNSSKVLQVSLQKVTSSKQDTVNLVAIFANYNAKEAMKDLNAVVASDDFVSTLSETPQSFEITQVSGENGEEYNVEKMEEGLDIVNGYIQLFRKAERLKADMKCIHWLSKGENFRQLHDYAESLVWELNSIEDFLAELIMEKSDTVLHVCQAYEDVSSSEILEQANSEGGFDLLSGMSAIRKSVLSFVDSLEMYYVNASHDVQSVMDNWIRELKKEADYFVKRTMM